MKTKASFNDAEYIDRSELLTLETSDDPMEIITHPSCCFLRDVREPLGYRVVDVRDLTKYDHPVLCDNCETSYAHRLDHMSPLYTEFNLCANCLAELGILPEGYPDNCSLVYPAFTAFEEDNLESEEV